MTRENYLGGLRAALLSRNEPVGQLEYTAGNFDDAGRLIEHRIPTITTMLCEIGIHGDDLYLVVILPSGSFSKEIFDGIRHQDIKIYGLKDFKTALFEKGNQASYESVRSSLRDEFVQIQFDFPWRKMSAEAVGQAYFQVKGTLAGFSADVVDQLTSVGA